MVGALTSPEEWRRAAAGGRPALVVPRSSLARYFDRWLPHEAGLRAIEVGALPGGHLLHLGERFGYACVALDYREEIHDLGASFEAAGIASYRLVHADFLEWEPDQEFDVVVSIGFVEHFSDPRAVIERHWRLLARGGRLFLGVPAFTPFQRAVRRLLYPDARWRRMLETHHRAIMDPRALRSEVERLEGSEILFSDYAMGCALWLEAERDVRPSRRRLYPPLKALSRAVSRFGISSRLYSPLALLVARRGEA